MMHETKPKWMIWCLKNKKDFTAIGSRKVNQIGLEADIVDGEYHELILFDRVVYSAMSPATVRQFNLTGAFAGLTMAAGKTEFEAFTALMHLLQQEERAEKVEAKKAKAEAKKATKELRKTKKRDNNE